MKLAADDIITLHCGVCKRADLFVAFGKPPRVIHVKAIELAKRLRCDGIVLHMKCGQRRAVAKDASRYGFEPASHSRMRSPS